MTLLELATRMNEEQIRPEIEIFDLSHIHGARRLVDSGLMSERPHVQFVLGVRNAMPADEHLRQWLAEGMTGCQFARLIAQERDRVVRVTFPSLASPDDVTRVFQHRLGSCPLVTATTFALERSECEVDDANTTRPQNRSR